jgi:hypothetical protein
MPAGEVGLFEHEPLVGGGDGLNLGGEFFGLGGKLPPVEFAALVIQVTEQQFLEWASSPSHAIEAASFITILWLWFM